MASPVANGFAANQGNDQWAIDIPCNDCCIYRVPTKLCKINAAAYTPQDWDEGRGSYNLHQSRERKIRNCYSEEFEWISDEEFVKMVKLDAIFIIELFWRSHKWTRKLSNEGYPNPEVPYHLSVNPCRKNITKEDLILLENQLPYFILEGFYWSSFTRTNSLLTMLQMCSFMELMQPRLELSHFLVEIGTEVFFRNLMALEQCHYPFETRVCKYMLLLDNLIVTAKDVDLLVPRKVIANGLGDRDAVSKLINELCDLIVPDDESDKDTDHSLSKKLNDYYENPWNSTMATLASTYFSDFWRGTATIAGLLVLGFAFWKFLSAFVM
ncbi:hypothetical protein CJ030_MR1G025754 [Morella rubra]|uniref:Uncharacterized protein n=1 Tax=Morella rubra TaxID=262757 RepID=A0A6A1WKA6_9ROSI|nr:hypothetical protein CJ030_MR1G025754 [Morella rubra]